MGHQSDVQLAAADLLDEIDRRLAHDRHFHARVGPCEARHDLRQEAVGVVVRRADANLSFQAVVVEGGQRLAIQPDHAPRIGEQALPVFRQAVGAGGIAAAESRLDSILRAETREVLGSVTSNDILSSDRAALMLRIRNSAIAAARALGVDIIDVRLQSTDLPTQNLAATFDRMRAEREREATDERARGNEAAQRIRAQADRTVVELVSEAQREAEIVRGEADALRNNIFAEAFGADEEFFEFYRSLTAYSRALKGGNSSMILSPDSEFFNYLKSPSGVRPTSQQSSAAGAVEAAPQAAPAPATTEDTTDSAATDTPAPASDGSN